MRETIEMTKEEALEILNSMGNKDNGLNFYINNETLYIMEKYISNNEMGCSDNDICLDGHFTAKELKAIVFWMENKYLF